jgi:putative flippase GtrA
MKPGVRRGDPPVPTDRLVDPQVEGARSPFYGVLLHGLWSIGTLWLLAAVQSLLAAWVLYLLWRTLAPKAPVWSYIAAVAACVVGTSVSFFTTFAMPDIFTGIGGAAMVLLLVQADRLRGRDVVGLWALVAYAMLIHKSNFGTGLVLGLVGAGLLWLLGLPMVRAGKRLILILTAAVAATLVGQVSDAAYAARTGEHLGHPPFMMARFLADGTGRAYMRHACAHGQPYALCQFQANVGSSTDFILWSSKKNLGVFNIASRATRVRLEKEEMRFVLGTILYDPIGQTVASLNDWGQQLIAYQVDDPLRNPSAYLRGRYWPTTIIPKLIPNFSACRPPGDCRPPFNFEALQIWHGTVLIGSLLLLGWRLTRADVRRVLLARGLRTGDERARVACVILLLIALTVINAAVCGILSGPFARYQSRVIWLIPAGAALMVCALPMRLGALASLVQRAWGFSLGVWDRIRAQPVIGRFLPPLDGHFMRFCVVGALGFMVDFTVLKTVVHLGMSPISGRIVSFPIATLTTWMTNRAWTFRQHEQGQSRSLLREFATYFAVQSAGFAANFTVYTGIVVGVTALNGYLLPPMIAGTAVGMVINYLGAKHIVFRRRAGAAEPL